MIQSPLPPALLGGRQGRPNAASRVVRGGSWNNDHRNVRCAYRNDNDPDNTWNSDGFRVAAHAADCQADRASFAELHASILGWANHVRYAEAYGLRRAVLSSWTL